MSRSGQLVVSRRLLTLEHRATTAYMRRDLRAVAKLRSWQPRFYDRPVSEFLGAKIVLIRVLAARDLPGDVEEATRIALATEEMLRTRPFRVATADVRELAARLLRRRHGTGGAVHLLDQAVGLAADCLAATDVSEGDQPADRVRLLSGLLVARYHARPTPEDHRQALRFCDSHPEICAADRELLGDPPR